MKLWRLASSSTSCTTMNLRISSASPTSPSSAGLRSRASQRPRTSQSPGSSLDSWTSTSGTLASSAPTTSRTSSTTGAQIPRPWRRSSRRTPWLCTSFVASINELAKMMLRLFYLKANLQAWPLMNPRLPSASPMTSSSWLSQCTSSLRGSVRLSGSPTAMASNVMPSPMTSTSPRLIYLLGSVASSSVASQLSGSCP